MAEVEPPDSRATPTAASRWGAALGGVTGVVVGISAGIVAFFSNPLVTGAAGRPCPSGGLWLGLGELAALAAMLFATWKLIRLRRVGLLISFARWFLAFLAVFSILPWPCSLGWTSVQTLVVCRPH